MTVACLCFKTVSRNGLLRNRVQKEEKEKGTPPIDLEKKRADEANEKKKKKKKKKKIVRYFGSINEISTPG